jgi:hypothetical protein
MLFFFLGAKIAEDTAICGFFVAWYLVFMNEKTCICSLQVSYALKQAYYFISKASLPNGSCVLSLDQVKIFRNVTGVLVNDSVTELVCS